jgi:hypothetical protein
MNWDNFTQRIMIKSSIDVLYNCFATSKGMESWFLRKCKYKREDRILAPTERAVVGDHYTFLWHGWSDDTYEIGSIIEANNSDTFKFSFNGNGATDMNVKVSLIPLEEGTMIDLHQDNIPIDEKGKYQWHVGCKTGWNFYLTNLKAVIEHNIDLRNKDMEMKNVLNC